MTAARRRDLLPVALFLATLTPCLFGEVLEFRTALGSDGSPPGPGTANFTSVEATPTLGRTEPARAFAGGSFSVQFNLGLADPLNSLSQRDGVLAGLSRDPADGGWIPNWLLQVGCPLGDAVINDVALSAKGEIFVVGTFEGEAYFERTIPLPQITLVDPTPGDGEPISFVAIASPDGEWLDAFVVLDMAANSIALDLEDNIFVTGPPVLARRYDPGGRELWSMPEPQRTISLQHIATDPDPALPNLYVLGSFDAGVVGGPADEDVFLIQLDKEDGAELWRTDIASPEEEHPGGLGVGPLGDLRVSVSSTGRDLLVDGVLIEDIPQVPARHSHLLFITPDGSLLGDRLLGRALDQGQGQGGEMETSDLAIDYAGNTYVAVSLTGPFSFKGVTHGGDNDAAIVAVDALGVPMRFSDSNGTGTALGTAVAAVNRTTQLMAGGAQDPEAPLEAEFFDTVPLPLRPEERAYFAALDPVPSQGSYLITSPVPGQPVDVIVQRINQIEGDIYRVLDLPPPQSLQLVSAYLTEEQLAALNGFELFLDADLQTDGMVSPSGWALEALNSAPATDPFEYTYPETCHQAVLYLIDTAIDTSSGFFNDNANLNVESSFLVRGVGDPLVSTKFDHGTEMLSMIAGPTYGAAQGTPVTVVSYDIYPDGTTAKVSSLIEAISLANSDKGLNYLYDPAVYCIASSATTPGASSSSLESVIDYAIGPNTYASILVSAGNTTGDASDYTPSDMGSKKGVICVGAIDQNNAQVPDTRGPVGVEIWAPGENIDAADIDGLATTVTGTSPATALAAGAALVYLSANPALIPGDLESAMTGTHAQSDAIGSIVHVPLSGAPGVMAFADWTTWYGLTDNTTSGNDDDDHWTNEEEYIWGLDPLSKDYQGSLVSLTYDLGSSTLTFEFPLSCSLYRPSALSAPHSLRDGTTLIIERSSDLETWTDITSTLTLVEQGHVGRQMKISFDYEVTSSRCFFRVRVQ